MGQMTEVRRLIAAVYAAAAGQHRGGVGWDKRETSRRQGQEGVGEALPLTLALSSQPPDS